MKHLKTLVAAAVACTTLAIPQFASADIHGPGSGYYYVAYSATGDIFSPYHYHDVGPFSTQSDCEQARWADYGDNNGWLPFDGSGISCTYVYGSEVGAMEDTLEEWSSLAGGGTATGTLTPAKLRAISELRRTYNIDRYEAEVSAVLKSR
jgi:hypothetical protein